MRGDFSRVRLGFPKHYTAVLQQQGRVALDADTNEQRAIEEHIRVTETTDIVGTYGGPYGAEGFTINVTNNTIQIGGGRYYVDGILCENEQTQALAYASQPYLINPQPTDSDLLNELTAGFIPAIHVWMTVACENRHSEGRTQPRAFKRCGEWSPKLQRPARVRKAVQGLESATQIDQWGLLATAHCLMQRSPHCCPGAGTSILAHRGRTCHQRTFRRPPHRPFHN